MKQNRLIIPAIFLVAIVLFAAAIFFGFTFGMYTQQWEGPAVRRIVQFIPIPAAKLGKERVLYRDYLKDVDSLQTFLHSDEAVAVQADRDMTQDDKQQVIERRLRELAVTEAARARSIELSQAEIDAAVNMFIPSDKTERDLNDFLVKNYRWDMDAFLTHMVLPALLTQKLTGSFAADHGGDPKAFENYLTERLQRKDVVRYLRW